MDLSQTLNQSLQFMLTPQMQLSMKLLQASHLELLHYIQEAFEENPLLELENQSSLEQDPWNNIYEQPYEFFATYKKEIGISAESKISIEGIQRGPSLAEHLHEQVRESRLSKEEKEIANIIIENIDQDGYLTGITAEEIANEYGFSLQGTQKVIEWVKRLDPVGCGSKDLQECLVVQANFICPEKKLLNVVLKEYFLELEQHQYEKIAKCLKVPLDEIMEVLKEIQKFIPKPGDLYSLETTKYIVPDVFIKRQNEDYLIIPNESNLPNIQINQEYQKETKIHGYINEQRKKAEWLLQAISQRNKTLIKIVSSIVKFQREFFEYGIEFLQPLTLQKIADDTAFHPSTISRAVQHKYLSCPKGVFELRYFFNGGVENQDGKIFSSKSIQSYIRELVKLEKKSAPYTDEQLVSLLADKHGIKVARRTVAKYREQLGILKSWQRK